MGAEWHVEQNEDVLVGRDDLLKIVIIQQDDVVVSGELLLLGQG
jgi:hypothetical protein